MLPQGFEPTDEWSRNNYGIGLAEYYKRNPNVQNSYENSPQKVAERAKQQADALAVKQKAETDARFASNKNELTDFNTRFQAAVPQIIGDTSSKYHLGDLLGQTNALGTRVKDLQTNMYGTGAGGYANASQVDKAVSTNYLPRYQQSVTNLGTATQLAQGEENQLITPYTTESTLLNERLAREATGYSQEQQRELDGLLGQITAGVTLSKAQMDQATALATAEKQYQQAVEVAKVNASKTTNADRYVSLGDGSILYDTQSGQIVANNPKNFSGGAGESFS